MTKEQIIEALARQERLDDASTAELWTRYRDAGSDAAWPGSLCRAWQALGSTWSLGQPIGEEELAEIEIHHRPVGRDGSECNLRSLQAVVRVLSAAAASLLVDQEQNLEEESAADRRWYEELKAKVIAEARDTAEQRAEETPGTEAIDERMWHWDAYESGKGLAKALAEWADAHPDDDATEPALKKLYLSTLESELATLAFVRGEKPKPADIDRLEKAARHGSFTSDTSVLLAMAELYEQADPKELALDAEAEERWRVANAKSAELLRGFARVFAAHERGNL